MVQGELFEETQGILTDLGGDEVEGHRILDVVKEIRDILPSISGGGGSGEGGSCECIEVTEEEIDALF